MVRYVLCRKPCRDARNPSCLTISAAGENLYAVNETLDFEGGPGGGLTAYARDPRTGILTALGSARSG